MNVDDLTPVSSSNIRAVGHDGHDLYVEFLNGSYYKYTSVPEGVYGELLTAESVGKYLNSVIKNTYTATRIN